MQVLIVKDSQGNSYTLITQDQNTNNCWANCIAMCDELVARCYADPIARVSSLVSKHQDLTTKEGAMAFDKIVEVCKREGLKTEQHDDPMNALTVRLQLNVNRSRPAIVALMERVSDVITGHVVVCLGWQGKAFLLLDPLATTLVELPDNRFPQYSTSYGRTWDFVGQSIIFV